MRRYATAATVLALFPAATWANGATPVFYQLAGPFRGNSAALNGSDIAGSSTFELQLIADPDSPSVNGEGTQANYNWLNLQLRCYDASGAVVYSASGQTGSGVLVANSFDPGNGNTFDSFAVNVGSSSATGDSANELAFHQMWLHLADQNDTVFDAAHGLALPKPFPALSAFGSYSGDNHFYVYFGTGPTYPQASFEVTSASASDVPNPTLAWAGTTGYASDGVSPDTGTPGDTIFAFNVKYTDATGAGAPTQARCSIQCRRDGAWKLYKRLNMIQESGDPDTGAIYAASTKLPNWSWRYTFRFSDAGGGDVKNGAPCERRWRGPTIISKPKVSWSGNTGYESDGVSPDSGTAGSQFRFEVLYQDSAGDKPTGGHEVLLKKDGSFWRRRTMTRVPGGSYTDGMVYERSMTISQPGVYQYKFLFADASGTAAGAPSRWAAGPTISGSGGSGTMLTGLTAASTSTGAQLTFTLTSSASVSARILNLAGRPVKTLCTARDCEAGANTLLWNTTSDSGVAVPSGVYLVEVSAKAEDGSQTRAVTQVSIRR